MELQNLAATTRDEKGTGAARRARTSGSIPAVLYGPGGESVSLVLDRKDFERMLNKYEGSQAMVRLEVTDKPDLSHPAQLRFVQRDRVDSSILHADFLRISLDKPVQTVVPLNLVGQPKGALEGGVLDQQLREIDIECLPLNVPVCLEVDVTDLGIGDSYHVGVVNAPEGVTILTDEDRTVAAVHAPRVLEETTDEDEEASAEVPEIGEEEAEEDED